MASGPTPEQVKKRKAILERNRESFEYTEFDPDGNAIPGDTWGGVFGAYLEAANEGHFTQTEREYGDAEVVLGIIRKEPGGNEDRLRRTFGFQLIDAARKLDSEYGEAISDES